MPKQGIDLSSVQLPPEDANKPAELDFNPAGDEGVVNNDAADKNTPLLPEDREGLTTKLGPAEGESQETPGEVKPEEKTTKQPAVDPDKKEEDKKTAPESAETGEKKDDLPKDGEKTEEKPAPFHEHPDWKKTQEEKHQLELDKARLEGRIEAMEKRGQITEDQKIEIKSAAKIAEEAVEKKLGDGWKPRDQLELNRVYGEELEKALDAKQAEKTAQEAKQQEQFEERRKEIQKQVENVYTEFGIVDENEQNKVANLAMQWAKDGTANWSINTLKLAADHLKAKGEILKPKAPEPKAVTPPDGETKTQNKNDVNKRISRPTSEGGATTTPAKKSIGEMRRQTLDDIVLKSVGALG